MQSRPHFTLKTHESKTKASWDRAGPGCATQGSRSSRKCPDGGRGRTYRQEIHLHRLLLHPRQAEGNYGGERFPRRTRGVTTTWPRLPNLTPTCLESPFQGGEPISLYSERKAETPASLPSRFRGSSRQKAPPTTGHRILGVVVHGFRPRQVPGNSGKRFPIGGSHTEPDLGNPRMRD